MEVLFLDTQKLQYTHTLMNWVDFVSTQCKTLESDIRIRHGIRRRGLRRGLRHGIKTLDSSLTSLSSDAPTPCEVEQGCPHKSQQLGTTAQSTTTLKISSSKNNVMYKR